MDTSKGHVAGRRTGEKIMSSSQPRRHRGMKTKFVTKKELHGTQLHVPSNPPDISYQPWYPTTLVHAGTSGDFTMKIGDLASQLVKQIDPHSHGFLAAPIMNFKIQRIRAWNLTGKMIALSVDDYSTPSKAIRDVDTLCGLVDAGSAAHIPAVGYALPITHQNIVLRNDTESKALVVYHISCQKSDLCMIYTTVLWRFDGPATVPQFQDVINRAILQTAASSRMTATATTSIQQSVQHISDHNDKSTIGNAIIHGVEVVAPFVIPAVSGLEERLSLISEQLRLLTRGSPLPGFVCEPDATSQDDDATYSLNRDSEDSFEPLYPDNDTNVEVV